MAESFRHFFHERRGEDLSFHEVFTDAWLQYALPPPTGMACQALM